MKKKIQNRHHFRQLRRKHRGFTLIELLLAMGIFVIVAGAAFSLFDQNVKLAATQQNLSGVNIGLRNAMSELEVDLSGAGQNLLGTVQSAAPVFGIGVNIQNNVPGTAATCTPSTSDWSYPVSSACFDAMTIFSVKPCAATGGTAPVLVIDDPGNSQESLASSSIMWGNDNNTGANLTTDASCFKNGDEVLVIQFPTNGQQLTQCDNGQYNYCIAAVNLTKDAQNSGGKIQLQHNPTGASADPLSVIFNGTSTNNFSKANGLGIGFSNGAYIIDIGTAGNTTIYSVQANPSDATDPQLMRCVGGTSGAACNAVADQVIGFKIGASLWDNQQTNGAELVNYFYNSAKYCNNAIADCTVSPPPANDPYDFSLVRAVRLSLVARTAPRTDQTLFKFKNGFDQGPYLVQQASVVVDLRNMSDNEFGN